MDSTLLKEKLRVVLTGIANNSTPGFPWMEIGRSNRLLKEDPVVFELLVSEAALRIRRMLERGRDLFALEAKDLVKEGLCDPIRVFVKTEPHKRSKIEQGKFRLISGVSIVDQMIDKLMFRCQNNLEIAMWEQVPSKPGIGLDDEGLQEMAQWFRKKLEKRPLVSTDISGWDWSVQEWELWADLDCRVKLCDGQESLWEFIARSRVYCVSRKTLVLPDGSLISQHWPGVQASGWYNTSSTNSRMRVLVRAVAYSEWCEKTGKEFEPEEVSACVAMGDDCVESLLDDEVYDLIGEYGHIIKEKTEFSTLEGVEFCSHRWYSDGLARPTSWVKTLFRFAQHPDDPIQLLDWTIQLRGDMRNVREDHDKAQIEKCIAAKLNAAKDAN
jgi:hypothetical protein